MLATPTVFKEQKGIQIFIHKCISTLVSLVLSSEQLPMKWYRLHPVSQPSFLSLMSRNDAALKNKISHLLRY